MNTIEILTFITRLAIAVMMLPFIFTQWKIRKRNGIVRRLRRHLLWMTSALVFLFLQAALVGHLFEAHRIDVPTWLKVFSLIPNLGVLAAFINGTRMFLAIHRGDYDNDHTRIETKS